MRRFEINILCAIQIVNSNTLQICQCLSFPEQSNTRVTCNCTSARRTILLLFKHHIPSCMFVAGAKWNFSCKAAGFDGISPYSRFLCASALFANPVVDFQIRIMVILHSDTFNGNGVRHSSLQNSICRYRMLEQQN